jgi:hypothetical protein
MEYRQEQLPPPWVYALDPRPNRPQAPRTAGDWIAIVAGDPKPTEYYTVELGHRGSRGPRLQWDGSVFYSWVKNATNLTPLDTTLEVPSKTHPGDSVTPLYNTNLLDRDNFGGEFLARVMPWDDLRLEASYSLFWTWNMVGLPIPNDPQHRTWQPTESRLRTPRHVGRLKAYMGLPWESTVSAFAILSSPFSRGIPFNYVTQDQNPANGVTVDAPRMQLQLDLTFQKRLFRDRLDVTLWGRNLLADPFVETYNQYGWISYPHQVHRTFGAGMDYRF